MITDSISWPSFSAGRFGPFVKANALPCVRARDRMDERREDSRRRSTQELQARIGKGC
jgi:hypothetical protein